MFVFLSALMTTSFSEQDWRFVKATCLHAVKHLYMLSSHTWVGLRWPYRDPHGWCSALVSGWFSESEICKTEITGK